MDVRVSHLPDPYRLDVAYAGGPSVGTVELIEFARPQTSFLQPYIQSYLREHPEVLPRRPSTEAAPAPQYRSSQSL